MAKTFKLDTKNREPLTALKEFFRSILKADEISAIATRTVWKESILYRRLFR